MLTHQNPFLTPLRETYTRDTALCTIGKTVVRNLAETGMHGALSAVPAQLQGFNTDITVWYTGNAT